MSFGRGSLISALAAVILAGLLASTSLAADTASGQNGGGQSSEPRVYVANSGEDSVSVVDASRGEVLAEIPVGKEPHHVLVSPDGERLYVADNASGRLAVLDPSTGEVLDRLPVGDKPVALAVSPPASAATPAEAGPAGQSASLPQTGGPRIAGYLPGSGAGLLGAGLLLLGGGLAARRYVGSTRR